MRLHKRIAEKRKKQKQAGNQYSALHVKPAGTMGTVPRLIEQAGAAVRPGRRIMHGRIPPLAVVDRMLETLYTKTGVS